MADFSKAMELSDRVLNDRRFCADDNHIVLAGAVKALCLELASLRKDANRYHRMRTETLKQIDGTPEEFDAEFDAEFDRTICAGMSNGVQP